MTLGAGESVGEGLLLDDSPHGTSARALQQTEAFVLRAEQVARDAQGVSRRSTPRSSAAPRARSRSDSPRRTRRSSDADARSASAARARAREHDLLGDRDVPDDALYGIQTLRALENFPITGIALREFPALIEALAAVKEAAALANAELGLLDQEIADVDRARRARDSRRTPSRALSSST